MKNRACATLVFLSVIACPGFVSAEVIFEEYFDSNPFTSNRWSRLNADCSGAGSWDGYQSMGGSEGCNGISGRWVNWPGSNGPQNPNEKCIVYNAALFGDIPTYGFVNLNVSFRYRLNAGDQINCAVFRANQSACNGSGWNNIAQLTNSGSWQTFSVGVNPGVTSIRFRFFPGSNNPNLRLDCILVSGDVDSDSDCTADIDESCDDDPLKTEPGECGCGVPESDYRVWYRDLDNDGAGDPNQTENACSQPAGYVANDDDECPSDSDLTVKPTWYGDSDGDGAGDPDVSVRACSQPAGYVSNDIDECPANGELTQRLTWYRDFDGDGFGATGANWPWSPVQACERPSGYVSNSEDQCPYNSQLIIPSEPCGCNLGTDLDNDLVCDSEDNCVGVENPDQLDADGDRVGDACDKCFFGNCDRPEFLVAAQLGAEDRIGIQPVAIDSILNNNSIALSVANYGSDSASIINLGIDLTQGPLITNDYSLALPAGSEPCDVEWGLSSNGDDLLDVVVAGTDGVFALVNDGVGSFTSDYINNQTQLDGVQWSSLTFIDVNGGGISDLVAVGSDGGFARIGTRLGDGGSSGLDAKGNLLPPQEELSGALGQLLSNDYAAPAPYYQYIPSWIDVDDPCSYEALDCHLPDLLVPMTTSNKLARFKNLGNTVSGTDCQAANEEGCNVACDGCVFLNGQGNSTECPCRQFQGFANEPIEYDVGDGPVFVTAGNLGGEDEFFFGGSNSSHYPDVVVVNAISNNISILINLDCATCAYGGPSQVLTVPVGILPSSAEIGDINGDGLNDILVTNAGSSSISTIMNAGTTPDGTVLFLAAAPIALPSNCEPTDLELNDLDGDSVVDIVTVVAEGRDEVLILVNNVFGTAIDCNSNGLVDAFEVITGVTADCNGNLSPDECDLAGGASDLNNDGIPDRCQGDIDGDGAVTIQDAAAMIAVLLNSPQASEHVPLSDLNQDSRADGRDVQLFVDLILGG